MKQAPDSIHIITSAPGQGEALENALSLRGFDRLRQTAFNDVGLGLQSDPPVLAVLDLGSDQQVEGLEGLLKPVAGKIKTLVLADSFNEDLFLRCHDLGVRDYLIKPIPEAYLVSRIIHTMQEARLEEILRQKDDILVEAGVLSERSGCFTTSHLMKQLDRQMHRHAHSDPRQTMSLILVALDGGSQPWRAADWSAVYAEVAEVLKTSSRGLDIVGEYLVDKFAVLLPNTGRHGAEALSRRLKERLEALRSRWREKCRLPLTIQLGLAETTHCQHYEDLLNQARASLGQ